MEESLGSQYALHIALQTLKERCQNLQQRLLVLEDENTALRVKCGNKSETKNESLTEIDSLKARIVQLVEQKAKLKTNLTMVANENRQLWTQLSNLSQVNKSFGSHLTKINESLKQHTKINETGRTPLIRSNTFTQSDNATTKQAPKAIGESDRISLELEDISLKLISTIAKEKFELEAQCSEMTEIQNAVVTNSFGFSYLGDDVTDSLVEEFTQHVTHLKHIKDSLLQHKEKLQKGVTNIQKINEGIVCKNHKVQEVKKTTENVKDYRDVEEELQLESLARWGTPENSNTFLQHVETKSNISICPMCNRIFHMNIDTEQVFLQHVNDHFVDSDDGRTNL